MRIVSKTYRFAEATRTLRIYGDQAALCAHLKHFRDARQPWHLIKTLRSIRELCQKSDQASVTALYDSVVPVIDRGITFACSLPLYVCYSEHTQQRPGPRCKYALLTHYGFVVVCNERAVLSAYFKVDTRAQAPQKCFEKAWHEIRLRCENARYVKQDGSQVQLTHVAQFSEYNWRHMPPWNVIAPDDYQAPKARRERAFLARPDQWSDVLSLIDKGSQ